jgi:hypothetical protein
VGFFRGGCEVVSSLRVVSCEFVKCPDEVPNQSNGVLDFINAVCITLKELVGRGGPLYIVDLILQTLLIKITKLMDFGRI